jgi:hypothetical protein
MRRSRKHSEAAVTRFLYGGMMAGVGPFVPLVRLDEPVAHGRRREHLSCIWGGGGIG